MDTKELEQFEALAKKYTKGENKDAVLKIIKEHTHEVFQEINDGGRSAAMADNKAKLEKAEGDAKDFKAKFEKAEADLKAIGEKSPDLQKLREAHDKQLADLRKEYEGKVEAATKETIQVRLDAAKQQLIRKLQDQRVDADYASTVLANKPDVLERIQVDGSTIRVLKAGSKDLHIVPGENKDALDHLAEELAEKTDKKWKVSGVSRGSGTTGNQGGVDTSKNRFDQIREEVQKPAKEREASKKAGSGLERLGRKR